MAVAALALPAVAPAHQIADLSGGVMTITGDRPLGDIPKPNDLITVDYDASAKEFVFGQDLFDQRKVRQVVLHVENGRFLSV